jgi:two-component system sensor histidine kinase BaeS
LRDDDGALLGVLLVLPTKDFDSLAEALGPQGAIDRRIATSAAVAIGLALLAALLVARHVADPVARLAVATRRLAAGDRSPRIASDRSDEVGQLVSAFNHLADSLETSEGLRRRLVADVAHELRTPLAALQGRIEAMQDGLDALDAQGLEALHSDVAHLTALVAELQDLALAEAGQLRLEPVALELASEARQAARALGLDPAAGAGAAGDGGLPALDLSGGPAHVFADPQRLRQILTNLLSNAIHHAAAQTIHVTVAERGARGVIIVEDDGVGIAPEALPHIFDRLYQADTLGRSRSGVGLGLAITRELVRIHGGSIEVASEVGAGTRFTVELPRGG